MLIDWFTVVAQVINFLILVWLLKRFLYRPILDAIDAREKRIAAELADADAKEAEAQKEREEFQQKNEAFDQQRDALMNKVTEEAKTERQRLLDEARQAADALSAKRQETLRNEAHNLNQAISRRAQQEVFAIARKALTDLAGTSLEERMGEVFIRRLRAAGCTRQKQASPWPFRSASDPARVRSAFDLPAEQRAAIQNALNETFSADSQTAPSGSRPRQIWSAALNSPRMDKRWRGASRIIWLSLEKGVDELLKDEGQTRSQSRAKD